jgi:hypothetical protein
VAQRTTKRHYKSVITATTGAAYGNDSVVPGNGGSPSGLPARGSKIVRAGRPKSQHATNPSSERYHTRVSLELGSSCQPGPYDLWSKIANVCFGEIV